MSKIIAAVDYSMYCPCLSINDISQKITFENTKFYYITKIVKHVGIFDNLHGIKELEYSSQEQRFDNITNTILDILLKHNVSDIAIEGYSYGSVGSVFDIAENTGVLKHKIFKNNINIHLIPPTEAKKFATNKGNANKQDMFDVFLLEKNIDFRSKISYTKEKIDNPVSDIVDSYFILKTLQKRLNDKNVD